MSRHKPAMKAVLVSDRPWNRRMVQTLATRTSCDFELISDPRDLTVARLSSIKPRFVFFPHWSHRIEQAIYRKFECVVFHMTDLPFGRGGSPLQNLIVRGIGETQISALRCVEELDAGPIYLKKPLSLHGAAEEIYLRAARIIERMIVEILTAPRDPTPQVGRPTTFKRRKPDEGSLAAARSLEEVFDLIRMLDAEGYPHAFLDVGRFRLEFTRASLKTSEVVADVRIRLAEGANDRDGE